MTGIERVNIIRVLWLIGFSFLIGSACSEKEPEGILPQSEMVDILRYVYLTESKIARLGVRYDSARAVFEIMRSEEFKRLGVDDTLFKRSFDWYCEHPDQLDQIYGAVIDSLNLTEQRLSLPSKTNGVP